MTPVGRLTRPDLMRFVQLTLVSFPIADKFCIQRKILREENRRFYKTAVSVAAIVVGFAFAGAASAQDCPRGDLDERYCDTDGDLLADVPTDPSEWLDPDTLIFAYTPVEDPAVYKEAWSDFLTYLEEKTGK